MELLDTIKETILDYVILPDGAEIAIALWAVFTHAHDCFGISPLLAITSATAECGKTRC